LQEALAAIDRQNITQFWDTWTEQVMAHPPGEFLESRWATSRRMAQRQRFAGSVFLALIPLGIATMVASAFIHK
jgi:hypothetical protein